MDDPAITMKNFAERDFAKVDDYFDVIQEAYLKAIGLASEDADEQLVKTTCETKLKECRQSVDVLRKELRKAIEKERTTPKPGAQGAAATGAIPKQTGAVRMYNDALRPMTIQLDSNPTEIRI